MAKCSFQVNTSLPRDQVVINPCFRRAPALTNMDGLAQDLANALDTWLGASIAPITVKFYDLEGTKPVFPDGVGVKNPGAQPMNANIPREIALCLSFYGDHPLPRNRGRLYLPAFFLGAGTTLRPNDTQIAKAKALGPVLASLGGADVDWIVWSRVAHAATTVKNYWVDDEWDTMRKRGMRSTKREVGTTGG